MMGGVAAPVILKSRGPKSIEKRIQEKKEKERLKELQRENEELKMKLKTNSKDNGSGAKAVKKSRNESLGMTNTEKRAYDRTLSVM